MLDELDEAVVHVVEPDVVVDECDGAFQVRDEQTANWVLRKLVEQRLYRERVRKWAEAEIVRSERQEAFLLRRFGLELEAWTRAQIAMQYGNRRSIDLPAGRLGVRQEPPKLVVMDQEKLLRGCRTHLPAAIQVKEDLLKTEIHQHMKSSGEIPDGAELGGGQDRFYFK